MSILLRLVEKLEADPPTEGSLVLIFQSAEETGQGAKEMVASGFLETFEIDQGYALHNIPGLQQGHIYMREGTFACASVGLRISLTGRTAHAAHPEDALNPLPVAVDLFKEITALPSKFAHKGFALATAIAVQGGDANFGTSPRDTTLMFTLRSASTELLDEMVENATSTAEQMAHEAGLKVQVELHEYFSATINGIHADRLAGVCENAGVPFRPLENPFRWSEDFGRFDALFPIAMFGIGSGKDMPALHAPTYDFPDEITEPGAEIFFQLYKSHCA
jgi:metal-dependent amidase/aminoacylase/carboxypeptidase family protein